MYAAGTSLSHYKKGKQIQHLTIDYMALPSAVHFTFLQTLAVSLCFSIYCPINRL